MKYPVTLIPDATDGGYTVTFPDIPEAITQGDTLEEALAMAREALATALEFYLEDQRPMPASSLPEPGQLVIDLPASS